MPLNLIFDANSPIQSEQGALDSFDSTGNAPDQDFVRGDVNLAISLRPVVAAPSGSGRPWDDCHLPTDTYQVAISNADETPSGGDYPIGIQAGEIATSSVASPTVITTSDPHLLVSGDTVLIFNHDGSTPNINGLHVATVTGANTFTIPVNVTVGGTGGIVYDATGLEDVSFDQSAATFETILSALSVKHGYATVEMELLTTGAYEATWQANGEVPALYSPSTNDLTPDSTVTVFVDQDGDADTQAIQLIFLRRSPVAYAEPATEFTAAAVTSTIVQAGSAAPPLANKIYKITLTAETYAGSYTIGMTKADASTVTIGVVAWNIIATDLLALLVSATGLDEDDFEVTRENDIVTIEFKGTQGNSNVPVITVTNIDLLAPKGVSGTIALNTSNLFRAFAATSESTLEFTLAVRRTRASGEEAEIFQHVVTLKRNIINVLTMVPVLLPTYLTEAQSDAKYAKITVAGIRELLDTGEINIASPDASMWTVTVDNFGNLGAIPA
jgi:hypothetical protein